MKRLLTDLRDWWRTPSPAQIEMQERICSLFEIQQEQAGVLVDAITRLTEAQAKQAEAYQNQLQQVLTLWTEPPTVRDQPLQSPRDAELLRDLRQEAKHGDPYAKRLMEDEEQLAEYLALFRES